MRLHLLLASFLQSGATGSLPGRDFLWIALIVGVLGLLFALIISRSVLSADTGLAEMRAIPNAIREGAEAFMSRQYAAIAVIAVVLAIALYFGYVVSPYTAPLARKVVISFLIGACCSGLSTSSPNPIPVLVVRGWRIFSIPSKAPPQTNRMLVVSTWTNS